MRPGDRVRVYEDGRYQGVATAIGNRWVVRFDFGRIVQRVILDKHLEMSFDENFLPKRI